MNDKLFIIIPAYNEEETIEAVVKEWHQVVAGIGIESRLVVLNDGSKDHTGEKLNALMNEYPQLTAITKPNSGHGGTVLYGYHYALAQGADYIFQTDSDGQTLASEFGPFWDKRTDYDVLIGHRNHRKDGASRVFVTKTLKLVLLCIFHLKITDANTPYRLMSKTVLEKHIGKVPENFNLSNVMLTVLFTDAKEKMLYMPITFRPRQGGVNSINLKKITKIGIQAVKDFLRIKKELKNKK